MSVTRSIDPNDYCQTCAWSEDEPDDAGHGYLNVRCERCEKLHDEQRHHEGWQEGAAVAFGLIGMAEAIRANGPKLPYTGTDPVVRGVLAGLEGLRRRERGLP